MIAPGHAKQQKIIILALHLAPLQKIKIDLSIAGPTALNQNTPRNFFGTPLHVCDTIKVMERKSWWDPESQSAENKRISRA
jgi:hypothetical protein